MTQNLPEPQVQGAIQEVQARLKGILHRRPGVALGLWGEAGVGKTHAAEGILRRLPCKSLRLHATTALGELARMPRPTLADWAEENLRRMAEGGDPFVPGGTEALTALLTQIAPVVVHLEDLHEASPKAQEAYGSLARMVGRVKGVALLATGRAQPPEPFVSFRLRWRPPPAGPCSRARSRRRCRKRQPTGFTRELRGIRSSPWSTCATWRGRVTSGTTGTVGAGATPPKTGCRSRWRP